METNKHRITCATCGESKLDDDFYRDKRNRSGRRGECKVCWNKRTATFHSEHPGYHNQITRNYRSQNLEKERLRWQEYYQRNKETKDTYVKEWNKRNPDKLQIYTENRRSKLRGADGKIVPIQWSEVKEKYGNKCLACGSTTRLELDHVIPISKNGKNLLENIQPLCRTCNRKKHTRIIDYRTMEMV